MAANPHIDEQTRVLRQDIEALERTITSAQAHLALKAEALKAIESLGLHTPGDEPAKPAKSAK